MIPSLPPRAATQVLVIRTAMLAGLLLFGGFTWYLLRHDHALVLAGLRARQLEYVFVALAVSTLGGLAFLRSQLPRMPDASRLMTLYISGYALCMGVALFGAVIWFLGGEQPWFIAGLVLMVVSFQILPVARAR